MKKSHIFIPVILFLFMAMNTLATTYYVKYDGNDSFTGTSWDAAFATLTKASKVAQTGDEIKVSGGIYQEGAELTISDGVSLLWRFFRHGT